MGSTDKPASPYTPGVVTTNIVGRDPQIERVRRLLTLVEHGQGNLRPLFYLGPRGVGKTSLLKKLQDVATEKNFVSVWVQAGQSAGGEVIGLVDLIHMEIGRLKRSLSEELSSTLREILGRTQLTLNAGLVAAKVDPAALAEQLTPPSRVLEELLVETAQAVRKHGSAGLVLFIDEVQDSDPEGVEALASAVQSIQSLAEDAGLAIIGAGLSHTQDVLTKKATFAERFTYVAVNNLSDEHAREVLEMPAAAKSVGWNEDALTEAVAVCAGYPYFLQELGDKVWEAATFDQGPYLSANDLSAALEEFEESRFMFFRSRWMKATEGERELMRAMAVCGDGPVRRVDVANKLQKTTSALSVARQGLIDKGIIESNKWGFMSFTAPGFASYVQNMDGDGQ